MSRTAAMAPQTSANDAVLDVKEEMRTGSGEVYFIRHGESESNRQGRFAGIFDVALTPFGEMQARRAGADIRSKGLKDFDAVYVSYMLRARRTCELALEESSNAHLIPKMVQDSRIAERSFGTFAGRNIALLRQAFGYEPFEHFMHSAGEAPPAGETMIKVYERAKSFMEEVIQPHIERGEKVLVVSHQYVIEPLAYYLEGLPATDFKHFNLPNGKAMSRADLAKYRKVEGGKTGLLIQKTGDMVALHGLNLAPVLFFLGVLLRFAVNDSMPKAAFQTLLTIALFSSTLYSYLEVDLPVSVRRAPLTAIATYTLQLLIRAAIVIPLLCTSLKDNLAGQLFALYWLVPPALTSGTVSLIWGGGVYLAVIVSLLASVLQPVLLIVLAAVRAVEFKPKDMTFFYILLGVGLFVPGAAAQLWRRNSPVDCKKHAKKWQWLGTVAFMALAFLSGFQFTPPSFRDVIFRSYTDAAHLLVVQRCYQQLWVAFATIVGMQAIGYITSDLWNKHIWAARDEGHHMDLFIILATPNIFLWSALATASGGAWHTDYARFWLASFFFVLPALNQLIILTFFSSDMFIEAHHEDKISPEKLRELWDKYDTDKSRSLDLQEMIALVRDIQKATTGSDHVNEFVISELFDIMDTDKSGAVDYDEFVAYFNAYGLAVNLNTDRVSRKRQLVGKKFQSMNGSSQAMKIGKELKEIP